MKLITEHSDNIEYMIEKNDAGIKQYRIEGVFAQAEKKNRNGRVYGKGILEGAVGKYIQEQVNENRAVGELNHPNGPTINLDRVSHRITDLRFEGNDVVGNALILDTPMGKIVKGLLEGGVKLGVSTRGMGSLERRNDANYVKDDFQLSTVDIVQDPSAPSAFVNGIMEGVEWVWNNGILEAQEIEVIKNTINNTSKEKLAEVQIKAFKDFLNAF